MSNEILTPYDEEPVLAVLKMVMADQTVMPCMINVLAFVLETRKHRPHLYSVNLDSAITVQHGLLIRWKKMAS